MSIKVMTQVWEYSNQSGASLLLLLALADHADDDGYCFPGIARLAKKTRKTPRAVQQSIADLVEAGELVVMHNQGIETSSGRTNLYQIKSPQGVKETAPLKDDKNQGVKETAPQGVKETAPQGVKETAPKPSVKPSVKPSGESGEPLPPPPTEIKKPSPKKEKTPKPPKPAAVLIYREVTHLYPPGAMDTVIEAAVGNEPGALEFWRQVVLGYIGQGWSPKNINGMIEFYKRGEIPSKPKAFNGNNGNGTNGSSGTTLSGEQREAYKILMSQIKQEAK